MKEGEGGNKELTSCNALLDELVQTLCLEIVWLSFDEECCSESSQRLRMNQEGEL